LYIIIDSLSCILLFNIFHVLLSIYYSVKTDDDDQQYQPTDNYMLPQIIEHKITPPNNDGK